MLLQADLHTHTIASTHAYSTVTENCRAAADIGLKAIAVTDHAMQMPDSPHFWHFNNMRVLPRKIYGVTVLRGAEANIVNYNGEIDLNESILKNLEWVVASYHKYTFPDFKPADPAVVTEGYRKLCLNPYVDMIGHPTTDFFPFEHEKAVKLFKEYGKLVEVNESSIKRKPGSAQNVVPILELCKKYEVPVVVNSDAHFWTEIAECSVSEKILSELDFPHSLIINSDWERVKEHILRKHPNLDI